MWPVCDWNLSRLFSLTLRLRNRHPDAAGRFYEPCLSGSWGPAQQKGSVAIGQWRMLEPNIKLLGLWPSLTIAMEGQTGKAWHRARAVIVWASEPRQPLRSAVSPEWRTANLHCLSCQLLPSYSKEYKVPKAACMAHIHSSDWRWGQEKPWKTWLAISKPWQGILTFSFWPCTPLASMDPVSK